MAFQKKPSLDVESVIKLGGTDKNGKPFPKQIEGFYLGSRTTETEMGKSTIHVFQTGKGSEGIWGSKTLNTTLGSSDVGFMVRVVHTGKKKLSKGRTQHTFEISIDPDQSLEVLPNLAASEDNDSGDADYEDEQEDAEETVEEVDEEEQAAQLAAAQARRTKVNSLLANKGKK